MIDKLGLNVALPATGVVIIPVGAMLTTWHAALAYYQGRILPKQYRPVYQGDVVFVIEAKFEPHEKTKLFYAYSRNNNTLGWLNSNYVELLCDTSDKA